MLVASFQFNFKFFRDEEISKGVEIKLLFKILPDSRSLLALVLSISISLSFSLFEELKKELDLLKTTRRKEVAESLEYARSLGDLSENAEYQEARDMQAAIEERIGYLEKTIKEAKIVAHEKHGDVVGLGSVVSIQKDKDKEKREYTIVGSDEANIHEHKLSYLSPLGEALFGKLKGDVVSISTPKGLVKYTIVTIQ